MASTNKTPKLGLNQWVGTDQFMREDFNRDNAKIDEMVGRGSFVTGVFLGDGRSNRTIELGFKPSVVMLLGYFSSSASLGIIMPQGNFCLSGSNGMPSVSLDYMALVSNGFTLYNPTYYNANRENTHYIAFY